MLGHPKKCCQRHQLIL